MSIPVQRPRDARNLRRVAAHLPETSEQPPWGTVHPMPERAPHSRTARHLREVDDTHVSDMSPATGIIVGVGLSLGLWAVIALALWLV